MRPSLPVIALCGVVLLGTAGALAQAEAERRLDAAIERLRGALGPEGRIEIGSRRLDPVSGRATLTDVVIHRGGDRTTIPEAVLSDLSETRIGRAELRNISERAADGTTADTGRVVLAGVALPPAGQPLGLGSIALDSLEVESLRAAGQDSKIVVARLAIGGWHGQAIRSAALEGLDIATADTPSARGDSFRLRRLTLAEVALPLAGPDPDPAAFRAGRIGIEGVQARQGSGDVAFSLGRFELRDWLPGRPTMLVLEDLQGAGPSPQLGQVTAGLDRFELSGVDAAGTLAAMLGNRQVPDPFEGLPQRVMIDGLRGSAEGQPLLALRRLSSEARLERGLATGRLETDGFRLSLPRGLAPALEALGYREITGGIEIAGEAPRAGGRLHLDPVRIAWDQAATLTLAARLDDMPPTPEAGAELDPGATLVALATAKLAEATLTLRDHGLLGRVLARQARQQRIPEARLREQWAQMALALPLPGTAPPPEARRGDASPPPKDPVPDTLVPLREALAAFIRQPGTLEITLRPPQPIAFEALPGFTADPAAALSRLGLTARAR